MSCTIEIVGGRLSPAALKAALSPHIDGVDIRLDVDQRTSRYRGGPETELLVAYIGGGTAAMKSFNDRRATFVEVARKYIGAH